MNLRKLVMISLVVLLVCQMGIAQAAPDKSLAGKAIAASIATGKPVAVVPRSTVAGKPMARPTIIVNHALGKVQVKPSSEPSFCQTYWPYGFIFCPKGLTSAYQVKQIIGANGGAGMTIAIVDAYAYPSAEADLAQFNSDMGLPPCTTANGCFTNVNLSPYDGSGSGWDLESMLDLQSAHSMAPNAKLVYVQAYDNSYDNLGVAVGVGAGMADVVSNSWSGGEDPYYDFYWNLGKVLLFSSGDGGSWPTQGFVGYPCSATTVTCVGGTSLYVNANLQRTSEVGWAGGGGGCSAAEPMQSWQNYAYGSAQCYPYRASPDVAAVADPATGFAVYWSYGGGYYVVGGTSLAAPVTAGLVANVDAARVSFGKSKFTFLNPSFYQAAASNYNYFFYDVTSGNNGYPAMPGFDLVTGLGNLTGKNAANRFFGLP